MKKRFASVSLVIGIWALVIASASAQVPQLINYQGRLLSGTNLVNGNVGLSLRLFNVPSGGTVQYEDSNTVAVADGLYSTFIGDNTTAGSLAGALTNATVYVEVAVNGVALSPREQISSVAFALIAGGVTNGAITSASIAAGAVTGDKIAAGTISNVNLAAGSVLATNIANGAITPTNLNIAAFSNTFASASAVSSNAFWSTAGNTGTTNGNFLGTTDNQPLEIRVGGIRAALITSSNGSPNFIFGPTQNVIAAGTTASSILGGSNNTIATISSYSVIGGGNQNNISNAAYSVVGGGQQNVISSNAYHSVLGGGQLNNIQAGAYQSFIGGGYDNSILSAAYQSFIGGGYINTISGTSYWSVVVGGYINNAQADYSFIGGGEYNKIAGGAGTAFSALVGGNNNTIGAGAGDFIGGGDFNAISNIVQEAVIAGGDYNTLGSSYSFMGAGSLNHIIGGVSYPSAYSVLVGGDYNTIYASTYAAILVGGDHNSIRGTGNYPFLGGGSYNVISNTANYSFLGGGQANFVGGNWATVGGGFQNVATNNYSTVPGGANNFAGGQYSFAAGANSTAGADYSFAAGNYAQSVHTGAFVWADAEAAPFASTNADSFNVRANGGVRFVTAGAGLTVDGLPVRAGNNGSSLTNLNASQLTTGTVPLAQLPAGLVTNFETFVSLGSILVLNNLTVSGKLNLPLPAIITAASLGNILYADNNANSYLGAAAGNANIGAGGSYNAGFGNNALYNNTNGSNNVAVGYSALQNNTTDNGLVAVGFQALQNDNAGNNNQTGDGNGHNTAVGYDALQADTVGAGNTATGFKSLGQNLAGSFNTAVGDNALNSNTSGSKNTAIGTAALQYSQNDSNLVAVGYFALQNDNAGNNNQTSDGNGNNTAIGYYALQADSSGAGNTATGHKALALNNSGSFNTALGSGALYSNTGGSHNVGIGDGSLNNATGGGNIALGSQAGINLGAGNNNIDIGNSGTGSDSGIIRIGTPGVQNQTFIAGTIQSPTCTVITITGGSDLAEPFSISTTDHPVSEGDVVVIDEANPGRLKLTDRPYDTRVAGVISGANGIHPGIQMHQQGLLEGGRNVALTGRVYVQADTSNGAIKPGDLLTTSGTPGHAMKVTDHAKAAGAILGKAMTGLEEGNGMVLVLVTLQ